jgi:uroporphyrinogen decarboxylase
MNSRERFINAIERKPLDRIPRYDAFWDTTIQEFQSQGMSRLPPMPVIDAGGLLKPCGNPAGDFFGFDADAMYLDISMRLPTEVIADDGERYTVRDRFGWTAEKYKGRSSSMNFIDHVTKTREDWETLKQRMILEPADVSRVDSESYYIHLSPYPTWQGAKTIFNEFRKREKYLMFACYGPYECTWRHHGYEQSLMDLVLEPDWMEEMLRRAADLIISTLEYAISQGMKPDGVFICEDLGEMRTTLFSPDIYRELLLPLHRKLAEFLHKNSIHLIMHCDGKVDSLIPYFIEAGIDVLQPLQANTGMDVVDLKARFGSHISVMGNIAVAAFKAGQSALEEEMRRKIPAAMRGGGYLYHSDHSVPPDIAYPVYQTAMNLLDEIGVYQTGQTTGRGN